jgi:hypothetical protein
MPEKLQTPALTAPVDAAAVAGVASAAVPLPATPGPLVREIGGPSGLEPTRYGDWEKHGRCIDF